MHPVVLKFTDSHPLVSPAKWTPGWCQLTTHTRLVWQSIFHCICLLYAFGQDNKPSTTIHVLFCKILMVHFTCCLRWWLRELNHIIKTELSWCMALENWMKLTCGTRELNHVMKTEPGWWGARELNHIMKTEPSCSAFMLELLGFFLFFK